MCVLAVFKYTFTNIHNAVEFILNHKDNEHFGNLAGQREHLIGFQRRSSQFGNKRLCVCALGEIREKKGKIKGGKEQGRD